MYFPKSQIQTGFFSNGELLIANSNTLYTGPYFITSDNQKYSGKEPNNGKNTLLIFPSENPSLPIIQNPNNPVDDPRFNPLNLPYSTAIKASRSNIPYSPVSYYPILTQDDINNGEFVRYFAKKSNQNLYTEIDSNNFAESVSSNLYISFQLPWVISGDKENVREINAKQIVFVEKNLQIIGLGAYLRFNYLQFYQE